MAKEGELKRVDLKVNVSCCDGCRRKVMKAMSLKGVLRTEIHPTLDRVTVVGNVDTALLVRKLAKVRKIAEVVEAASPEEKKKREDQPHGRAQDRDGGDWTLAPAPENSKRKDDGGDWPAPAPVMAGEKSKSKGDGKDSSSEKPSSKKECHKCAQQQQKQQSARGGDHGDHGKAPAPSSKGDAESAFKEENDGFAAEAKPSPPEHAPAAAHQRYHRAEPPSMAVPMQYNMPTTPYYAAAASVAAPSYYNGGGGYYAMPPPPPAVPTMPMQYMPMQQQLVRAQPSRFDVDYFNEDNAVGCHVM